MNKSLNRKRLVIVALIAIVGFSAYAYADWGMGSGHMGRGGWGPGWNRGGGYGPGYGYSGNLPAEELQKLEQERAGYFKATEDIRRNLYAKDLELRSELAKENPDINKASQIQGEISRLQSELDQKHLDFEMSARKTAPSYNRGYRGYGSMMGYGSQGGGYCMW